MAAHEIALITRAKGLRQHLLGRARLEHLAETEDLRVFVRDLFRPGGWSDPPGEEADVMSIDRAVGRATGRFLCTLERWQERAPGILDIIADEQDRRSVRALLRGALQGSPTEARLQGLLPTRLLPHRVLSELARLASAAEVTRQLLRLGHPDAPRLRPLVERAQPDLFAMEVVLLQGVAARAIQAATGTDETVRDFVRDRIDIGNVQNALLLANGPHDVDPIHSFVEGGRWLSRGNFVAAAGARSEQEALATVRRALISSPLHALVPVFPSDVVHLDRRFLTFSIKQLAGAARRNPLTGASVLHVLLRIEAQIRDLRALAWGAALRTPSVLRKQQLLTPP